MNPKPIKITETPEEEYAGPDPQPFVAVGGVPASDASVNALLTNPESETSASLNATIARGASRAGIAASTAPLIVAGDSISTTGYAGTAIAATLGGYPSGQRVGQTASVSAGNAAVAGDNSTQLLARFDTDVIAKEPAVVHILIGTNDAGNGVPIATFAANIRTMVDKCRQIGARIILGTVPPSDQTDPTNQTASIIAYNAWLVRFALQQGIQVADYYAVLVDPVAGGFATGFTSDGTHPTPEAIGLMAAELHASITRPATAALLLPKDDADPWNFVRNALFVNPMTTGWTAAQTHTNVTTTIEADAAIPGSWAKMTAAASPGMANYNQNRNTDQQGTAYAVGNWIEMVARVKSTALSSGQYWEASNKFVNVATMYLGTAQNRFELPAGGALVVGSIASEGSGSNVAKVALSAGTGDIWFAQVGVYDLTAMGVTDTEGVLI